MKKNDLSKIIYDQKLVNKINKKITLLGLDKNISVYEFLNTRLITSIIIFLVILYFSKYGYILAVVFVVLYYYLFEWVLLDNKIKKRTFKLNIEAIYFFEVLTLSLQTGRNLVEAISITVNSSSSELALEFKKALRETKYGKSLNESLSDMQKYIPSDSINNIIIALTQTNIYGSNIIDTMYNQVDYLREKRIMEVKSKMSKIPTKISIISVFFFIPLILLIILGPAVLSYLGLG